VSHDVAVAAVPLHRPAAASVGPVSTPEVTLTPETPRPDRARRLAEGIGTRVGLDGVLADLQRVAQPVTDEPDPAAVALTWAPSDVADATWWPQGLATDAEDGSRPASVLLSAWYAKGPRGWLPNVAARISVLSLSELRYEHVLLQSPGWAGLPLTRAWPVPVHAGGLAWVGDLLLVADTRRGVRVFDLRDVTRLTEPVRGCRFALPQQGQWTSSAPGTRAVSYSFLSQDASADGRWLLAGEYSRPGDGTRLLRYPLEPLLAGQPSRVAEVVTAGLAGMQGVARVGQTYWVSGSRGRERRGRLWRRREDGGFDSIDDVLPTGCEDLSYDAPGNRLWTQGEYPGDRRLVGLPMPPGHN
jgi:hypothetical protein